MAGNALGAQKVAAGRVGVTLDEYRARLAANEKWCYRCRAWHPITAFPLDRSRGDRRKSSCLASWHGVRKRAPSPIRDAARSAVRHAVLSGRMPHPNSVPCTDCGDIWRDGERRHEHDHHLGYEPAHRLDVEVVCTTCHADREKKRRAA